MSLVDTALVRSMAFGYSNIGFALRKARWDGRDPRAGSLAGRTVVVTGATSGIGAAIAEQVVDLDATVVIVGRNSGRATAVRDRIQATAVLQEDYLGGSEGLAASSRASRCLAD